MNTIVQHGNLENLIPRIKRSQEFADYGTMELLDEYSKFLALKCVNDDTHSETLIASPVIEKVWSMHILETKTYKSLQKELGICLHYYPEMAYQPGEKSKLAETTKKSYQNVFWKR